MNECFFLGRLLQQEEGFHGAVRHRRHEPRVPDAVPQPGVHRGAAASAAVPAEGPGAGEIGGVPSFCYYKNSFWKCQCH